MNKSEFETAFRSMTKALNVKVPVLQANLYFEEFRAKDSRDFAAACHELSFGKAGWMPQMDKYREYVTAASEMRHEKEKAKRNEEADKTWAGHNMPQDDPMESLWGQACLANIKRMLTKDPTKRKEQAAAVIAILNDETFWNHNFGWFTKDLHYPRPQDWLKMKLEEGKEAKAEEAVAGFVPVAEIMPNVLQEIVDKKPAWEG
jgi:hypothetical protein